MWIYCHAFDNLFSMFNIPYSSQKLLRVGAAVGFLFFSFPFQNYFANMNIIIFFLMKHSAGSDWWVFQKNFTENRKILISTYVWIHIMSFWEFYFEDWCVFAGKFNEFAYVVLLINYLPFQDLWNLILSNKNPNIRWTKFELK